MITTILWDVDRTLLDFDAAERAAIQSLYIEFGLGECSEEALARYSAINRKYWEKMERGEITKQQVLVGRFEEFFAGEGIDTALAPRLHRASTTPISCALAIPSSAAMTAIILSSRCAARCASMSFPTERSPRRQKNCASPASVR